jgi:flagellar hook-associated protein 3 FlgL
MIQARALSGLQTNMSGMARLQEQIASGRRINRPSDDPVGVGSVLQTNSSLSALTQYQRNLEAARSRQTLEEQTLGELTNVLERAKELGVAQGTATSNARTRRVARAEVDRLIEFTQGLGNTTFQGRFLFGGQYADRMPFASTTPDPLAPPSGALRVEVGPGQVVDTNRSGQEVFVDTGVFTAMEELSTALGNDDAEAIRDALTSLDAAFAGVQELVGDVGARLNSLDVAAQNLDALEVNLESLRSSIQDTDFEEAVTELVNRQTTFQAALAANAQILGQSLADYL